MKTKKQKLIELFYRSVRENDSEHYEKSIKLTEKLCDNMPFTNEQQKEQWIDLMQSYKFFEDIEKLTLQIINEGEY